MRHTNLDLSQRIEQVIREHLAATQTAAREAIERAFAGAAVRAPARVSRRASVSASSGNRKRRAPAEIASLGDQFLRAVRAKPGESMTVLAADVGASARELHRAVALLKQAGRVRSVGNRQQTRYFPTSKGAAASA
jgi:hypothetical protein